MKVGTETLAAKLKTALGPGLVVHDPSARDGYSVDGQTPGLICFPADPDQVSAALALCTEAEACVIPWGGGTAMRLGNIARRVDVVIGLERMDRLLEHDDANLTATVEAGMKLDTLQNILGQRGQFLPLDPPQPTQATIGGVAAANSNGPRRTLYGGVRDLVLGMKMVLASGERIKAGGKVVKNVAGYDLCKLFVGSLGTLGIITEVTFKMAPLPEAAATVAIWGPMDRLLEFVRELSRSALLPAAAAILNANAARMVGLVTQDPAVVVWAEGFKEAVGRHLRDLQGMAQKLNLACESRQDQAHGLLWEQVRDFPSAAGKLLYRVAVPLASVAGVITTIDGWSAAQRAHMIAHAGSGTVWFALDPDPSSLDWFPRLTALAQEHRGHAVIAAAPPELKRGVEVWGPPPPSLALMRRIKSEFDPHGIVNPGRFTAGL